MIHKCNSQMCDDVIYFCFGIIYLNNLIPYLLPSQFFFLSYTSLRSHSKNSINPLHKKTRTPIDLIKETSAEIFSCFKQSSLWKINRIQHTSQEMHPIQSPPVFSKLKIRKSTNCFSQGYMHKRLFLPLTKK